MNSTPTSSTSTAPAASQGQTTQNGKKRKSPSQLTLLRKRIRQNLITCPVAISILRDLGLRKLSTLNSGNFLAWTVDPTDPIFQTIHDYVSKGQPGKRLAPWHPHQFSTKILGILQITPGGGIPPKFDDNPNNRGQLRMMLWRGGRAIDVRNVLKKGLKLRKTKSYQMWGAGYYFNDRICDAVEWSWDNRYAPEGEQMKDLFRIGNVHYLYLCEVLLGNDMYLTYTEEGKGPKVTPKQSWLAKMANKPPPKPVTVDSIKCIGRWTQDPQGNKVIDDCTWPLGESVENWRSYFLGDGFWASQYIVYDEKRVIPRYLVKVEIIDGVVKEKIC